MTEVVLHIGLHRTGTTTIQRFLNANRSALAEADLLYPVGGFTAENANRGHRLLVEAVQSGGGPADPWTVVLDEIDKSSARRVLLSAEEFSRMTSGVDEVAARLDGYEVRAVMYVRHPVSFLVSAWKQQVKTGAYTGTCSDFMHERWERADYGLMAQRWEAALGRGRVQVRVYEEAEQAPGLIDDFLDVLAIDVDRGSFRQPRERINASPDDATLAVVRVIGKLENRYPSRPVLTRLRRAARRQEGLMGTVISRIGGLIDGHPVHDDDTAWLAGVLGERHRRFLDHYVPPEQQHHLVFGPGAPASTGSS
ncbi:MAG: hypothetical protein ACR2QE_01185 [Acidimicrobiales bacterium]